MDIFTIACLLFTSAGTLGVMAFRVPSWSRSPLSNSLFGHLIVFLTTTADWFGLVALIYTLGWLSGIGYWLAAGVAAYVFAVVTRLTHGFDGLMLLIGLAMMVAACVFLYLG